MKNKVKGNIIIVIGILVLLLGIFFFFYNEYEDYNAGKKSAEVLDNIKEYIKEDKSKKEEFNTSKKISGHSYMGYITISRINVELPIMDEWNYKKLKISPCIHFGSIESNDLVIAAHAYKRHFKNIDKLTKGDIIEITDLNGNKYKYQVMKKKLLDPKQVNEVKNSGYDLVLYTCNWNNTERITIFCNRI